MAIGERMMQARFGDSFASHHTYVIAGDGCLMEGISHEAIDMAGHLKLDKLIVLWDDNSITIDGSTGLSTSTDQLKRFEAAGWSVCRVDGHNPAEIETAIANAQKSDKPSLIACRTIIGYGAPNKQGSEKTHGAPLGKEEIAAARVQLGWPYPAFEVPEAILSAWREAGARGRAGRGEWEASLESRPKRSAARSRNCSTAPCPPPLPKSSALSKPRWWRRSPSSQPANRPRWCCRSSTTPPR